MSRRLSLFKKANPGKPRVHFPDELVFADSIKEHDTESIEHMLRRNSLKMDINANNSEGFTPLHQAVLDENFTAARLLINHGADMNKQDEDTWTPLHAGCAIGCTQIVRYLVKRGADTTILTEDGQRPIDLCDPGDLETISVLLQWQQEHPDVQGGIDSSHHLDDSNMDDEECGADYDEDTVGSL